MKYKYRRVVDWKYQVKLECGHTVLINKWHVTYSGLYQKDYFQVHKVRCEQCGLIHDLKEMINNEMGESTGSSDRR